MISRDDVKVAGIGLDLFQGRGDISRSTSVQLNKEVISGLFTLGRPGLNVNQVHTMYLNE